MLVKSKVKYIQTLGQKKFRQEEGLFIAEGPKLVLELLEATAASVREIFALPDWITAHQHLLQHTACTPITEADLEKISQLTTPNKVLALVKQFDNSVLPIAKDTVVLALDTIQDPGNLGTIIRIADWFGITQIVCNEETADQYNSKVVQATMGSIARVSIYYTDLISWIKEQKGVSLYAAALDGRNVTTMDKVKEGIIVIGNESKGISPEILEMADVKITIPRKGQAESLNAAVAAGIILSHLV